MTIEASHYGETRAALKADPIIQDMAGGCKHIPLAELAYEDGGPKGDFMMAALREYNARGGAIPTHIGGPAEAILELLREETN